MSVYLTKELIDHSVMRMEENTPRVKKCFEELADHEIWQKPNGISNSIGNLVLHLCGNIRQYIISSVGNIEDSRERDKEFSASGGISKSDLLDKLTFTVSGAIKVIKNMDEESLLKKRLVQGFELSGVGIVIHVVEHYSYHTGQIAFWTKILKNKDLGFYTGKDLNKKNTLL
jgi:uncharacterized damage-inducible protein DinB